jgi:hypothetical protein
MEIFPHRIKRLIAPPKKWQIGGDAHGWQDGRGAADSATLASTSSILEPESNDIFQIADNGEASLCRQYPLPVGGTQEQIETVKILHQKAGRGHVIGLPRASWKASRPALRR